MLQLIDIIDENKIEVKLKSVENILKGKKVIIAFSGGVDSSVVAYLSKLYAKSVLLVMQIGVSVAEEEILIAQKFSNQLDLQIKLLEYDEIDESENYAINDENRCYYCKQILHIKLEELRNEFDFDLVLSGTNYSDLQGHRPGYNAIKEIKAVSPLVIAKLDKSEVRWIAKNAGLNVWNKPATACLASRIIHGVRVTKEALIRISKSEEYLKDYLGIKILRVRDHDKIARIEVSKEEIPLFFDIKVMEKIYEKLKEFGYKYVSLDLLGYRPSVPTDFNKN